MFNSNKKKKILMDIIFSFFKSIKSDIYTKKIPVFTFHRLVPDDVKQKFFPYYQWIGSIKIFEKMIKYLYDNGYKTINTTEFYSWYIGKVEYKKKTVLVTIDDGFYEDYYLVYPIIKKYNFKATSFIIGSKIKEKTLPYDKYKNLFLGMDVINKVREEYPYFEFQSHSYNMHFINMTNKTKLVCRINSMSNEELEKDIFQNKKFGFTSMSYPYGCFNEEMKKMLEMKGYLISFRFGPSNYATRNSERFAIPRIKLDGFATVDTLKNWLKNI